MKKKLFATLLVLVVLCMPMFLLTGCGGSDAGNSVTLTTTTTTTLDVIKGQSITEVTWGLSFNYQVQRWDAEKDAYRYVDKDGKFYDVATNYYASPLTDTKEILDAGVSYRGFDSSKVTAEGVEKEVTFSYGGKTVSIKYRVVAGA